MARPTRGIALETRRIQLPAALWAALDSLHHDPVRGKPRYGAYTRYFEQLVRSDLKARNRLESLCDSE